MIKEKSLTLEDLDKIWDAQVMHFPVVCFALCMLMCLFYISGHLSLVSCDMFLHMRLVAFLPSDWRSAHMQVCKFAISCRDRSLC